MQLDDTTFMGNIGTGTWPPARYAASTIDGGSRAKSGTGALLFGGIVRIPNSPTGPPESTLPGDPPNYPGCEGPACVAQHFDRRFLFARKSRRILLQLPEGTYVYFCISLLVSYAGRRPGESIIGMDPFTQPESSCTREA